MRSGSRRLMTPVVLSVLLACATSTPSHAVLVGRWSFDACTGVDSSGNNRALTPAGAATCGPGRFATGYALDGSTQYLDRAPDAAFTPGARAWTVTAWVKSTVSASLQMVVDWYRCGANPGCNAGDGACYILSLDHGHPSWDIRDDAITDVAVEDSTLQLADGAWHHLAGTMNPAADSVKLYVDGALRKVASGPITTLSSGNILIPFEVGRHYRVGWDVPAYYLNGSVDEVRVYDQELSAVTIAGLAQSNAALAVGPGERAAFTIDDVRPNPSRGGPITVSFALPSDAPAQLAVFDVAGRRVARVMLEHPAAGPQSVELGAGRALAPGLYMVRLAQGALTAMQRATVIR